jgi:hypothetical protein
MKLAAWLHPAESRRSVEADPVTERFIFYASTKAVCDSAQEDLQVLR